MDGWATLNVPAGSYSVEAADPTQKIFVAGWEPMKKVHFRVSEGGGWMGLFLEESDYPGEP